MAFYSVRVNDDDKEIEPRRTPNFSKLTFRGDNLPNENSSSRSSNQDLVLTGIQSNINDNLNGYKKVRYINSAAFIEKEVENPNKQIECEDLEIESHRSSIISNKEITSRQYQSHIIMGNDLHIPMLELNSNESFPSSDETSYSYSKIQEVTRIIQKPDAYKEWVKAKKMSKMYEEQRKREKDLRIEKETQERKEAAEKRYKEWMNKKLEKRLIKEKNNVLEEQKYQEIKNNNINNVTNENKEKCFKLWLKSKRNTEKQLREVRKQKIMHDEEQREERKNQAEILYNDWLKNAPCKPKPVPLNRGLFTFKGTISDVFINPVPWHKENPEDKNSNSL